MKRKFTIMTLCFVFLMAFASISKAEVSTSAVSVVNSISTTTTTKGEISLMKQKLSVLNSTNCSVMDGCDNALNLATGANITASLTCIKNGYGSNACTAAVSIASAAVLAALQQCSVSNNLDIDRKLFLWEKAG